MSAQSALLKVDDLVKHFPLTKGLLLAKLTGKVRAVDGVSFEVEKGRTLGLVGESGCGKSTTARCILRLMPATAGSVFLDGQNVLGQTRRGMGALRRRMQVIFQDPYSSLNPRMTVGEIVGEPMAIHGIGDRGSRKNKVKELLDVVGLNPEHVNRYPHEFSGGQRQRVGVARALALNPELVICDEPVSALDVSIRAQILNLLQDLQKEFNLTYLFISHDLSVVRHISDRVAVMYLGKIVEEADRDALYAEPHHPYTQALLSAVPVPDPELESRRKRIILTGDLPSPIDPPSGCRFRTRCPIAVEKCAQEEPPLAEVAAGHKAACFFACPSPIPV